MFYIEVKIIKYINFLSILKRYGLLNIICSLNNLVLSSYKNRYLFYFYVYEIDMDILFYRRRIGFLIFF